MTAGTSKSTKAAALTAKPYEMLAPQSDGGRLRVFADYFAVATTNTDDVGDVMLMLPVPSNLVPHSLVIFNSDLDGGGPTLTLNIGLANGPEKFKVPVSTTLTEFDPDEVIDADCFADGDTVGQAANIAGKEVLHTTLDLAKHGQPLWEIAGLDEDPKRMLQVRITVKAAATSPAVGKIVLRMIGTE